MSYASTDDEEMSKATRLVVAGYVAPRMRADANRSAARRLARVDANGNVVGYTTLSEFQKRLLERAKIELDVQDGARPKEVLCEKCGGFFRSHPTGARPKFCVTCREASCCPDCAEPLATPRSKKCRACAAKTREGVRGRPRCEVCDTTISYGAKRCLEHKVDHPVCITCGSRLPNKDASRCRACYLASRADSTAGVVCGVCSGPLSKSSRRLAKITGAARRCASCKRKRLRLPKRKSRRSSPTKGVAK